MRNCPGKHPGAVFLGGDQSGRATDYPRRRQEENEKRGVDRWKTTPQANDVGRRTWTIYIKLLTAICEKKKSISEERGRWQK